MGRHMFDAHRSGWTEEPGPSSTSSPNRAWTVDSPSVGPEMGEGVLDMTKDFMKWAGKKTANKLANKSGRKIGEEIVALTQTDASLGPKAQDPPKVQPNATLRWAGPSALPSGLQPMKENESAGDRIREILEANSITHKARTPLAQPTPTLKSGQRSTTTQKVNETVSRLLADDD